MNTQISKHDNFPKPTRWTRTTAIEAFGVTYLHDDAEGKPIREVLGRREPHPWEALHSTMTAFSTDGEAILHACSLARDKAEREIEEIDARMSGRGTRLRLALARNWKPAREREIGLLATESILDRRRRECQDILEKGVRPEVKRLPDDVRIPIVLPLALPVHVVDMRGFPEREVTLREATIVARDFIEAHDHPGYDILPRYRVEGLEGTFSYDQDSIVHKTLEGTPDGLRIFLLKQFALAHIHGFSNIVQDRLVQSLGPVIDIAPRLLPQPPQETTDLASQIASMSSRDRREADVIPFPAIPAPEPVEILVEDLPATQPLAIEIVEIERPSDPPTDFEPSMIAVHSPEPETAVPYAPLQIPEPVDVDDAFSDPEPSRDVVDASMAEPVAESEPDDRLGEIAAAAIELALRPVPTVDDEFDAMIETAPAAVAPPEPREPPAPRRNVLSRISALLGRKAPARPDEMTIAPRPVKIDPTPVPFAFVAEAIDFANSVEEVSLAPVPPQANVVMGQIEAFLARGEIVVVRPGTQRESDSLAIGLIGRIDPSLLSREDDTLAA